MRPHALALGLDDQAMTMLDSGNQSGPARTLVPRRDARLIFNLRNMPG
jgi:hypothetical protein